MITSIPRTSEYRIGFRKWAVKRNHIKKRRKDDGMLSNAVAPYDWAKCPRKDSSKQKITGMVIPVGFRHGVLAECLPGFGILRCSEMFAASIPEQIGHFAKNSTLSRPVLRLTV